MELELLTFIIVCPLVFIAGFIDAIAGGGGLIALPAYFISGLPAHMALGTNKLSSMMGTALTTFRYAKLGYIDFKKSLFAVIFSFIGSALGARLALFVPDREFKIALLFLLPVTAIILFKKRTLESSMSVPKKLQSFICCFIALVIGVYDGIYGPGTGTFLIIAFCAFAGLSVKNSNGMTKAVNLTTNIAAFTVFALSGSVIFYLGLVAGLFSLLGNYLGSKYFERKGAIGTKPVMIFVIMLFIVKIIYELI